MREIHIGVIIKQRRLELGLTQEELCEGICEPPTMSRIEKGHQTPTSSKLKALLSRLGLPSEKYYAMLSENELEVERLKSEIIDCNTRHLYKDGLKKIDKLTSLIDEEDHIIRQFIARSRVLLGKLENEIIVPYSTEEKLNLLFEAIKMTIPNFDIDEIGRHWYSLDEMKIINQIGITYGDNGQLRPALDVYYQLMKYIRKRITINNDTATVAILSAHNYSLYLCLEKRYEEAIEIANWGWDSSIKWARSSNMGGLLYVLAESNYQLGNIDISQKYYTQSYYAYTLMKDTHNAKIISENIEEYFAISLLN